MVHSISTAGRSDFDGASLRRSFARADHWGMEEVVRLIDGDQQSLDVRIARTLERVGSDWRVARFTYWYTGRPPVHEALIVRLPRV
jgi:hypothetical protein